MFDTPEVEAAPVVCGKRLAEQKNAEYCELHCSSCEYCVGRTDQFDETEVKTIQRVV